MKMYFYAIICCLLISCSNEVGTSFKTPYKDKKDQDLVQAKGQENGETIENNSEKEDKPAAPAYFFDSFLNGGFVNCVNTSEVISMDHSEGLAVYNLKKPLLVSPGKGIISANNGDHIQANYHFVENGLICTLKLSIHHVQSDLSIGDSVFVNDTIGLAKKHDSHYRIAAETWSTSKASPGKYKLNQLNMYGGFVLPEDIRNLIIIDKGDYHFWYYVDGELTHHFPIALGQDPSGHKVQQGDNKTPEGQYMIVEKMKGPFSSPTGPWLGNSWFRLNYPNKWDAEKGYTSGLITKSERDAIVRAFNANRDTPNNTKLGGHIGIHGWNGDWYDYDSHDVTWGCVSMRNHQIDDIYNEIPVGTWVFIIP